MKDSPSRSHSISKKFWVFFLFRKNIKTESKIRAFFLLLCFCLCLRTPLFYDNRRWLMKDSPSRSLSLSKKLLGFFSSFGNSSKFESKILAFFVLPCFCSIFFFLILNLRSIQWNPCIPNLWFLKKKKSRNQSYLHTNPQLYQKRSTHWMLPHQVALFHILVPVYRDELDEWRPVW